MSENNNFDEVNLNKMGSTGQATASNSGNAGQSSHANGNAAPPSPPESNSSVDHSPNTRQHNIPVTRENSKATDTTPSTATSVTNSAQHSPNSDASRFVVSPNPFKQPISVIIDHAGNQHVAYSPAIGPTTPIPGSTTATGNNVNHHSPPPIYTSFYPPGAYMAHQVPPAYDIAGGPQPTYIIDACRLNGAPAYVIRGDQTHPVYIISAYNEFARRRRALAFLSFFLLLFPIIIFLIIMLPTIR
ncbi:hypothetical protein Ddc_02887 [Ditylenchus destructor]|nr:hypothetical protein Ddc_02887 [Ditylenchus destructor]